MTKSRGRAWPVMFLLLLAPLVAEVLWGTTTVTDSRRVPDPDRPVRRRRGPHPRGGAPVGRRVALDPAARRRLRRDRGRPARAELVHPGPAGPPLRRRGRGVLDLRRVEHRLSRRLQHHDPDPAHRAGVPRLAGQALAGPAGTSVAGAVYAVNAAVIGLLWWAYVQPILLHVPARVHPVQQGAAIALVIALIAAARLAARTRTSAAGGPPPPAAGWLAGAAARRRHRMVRAAAAVGLGQPPALAAVPRSHHRRGRRNCPRRLGAAALVGPHRPAGARRPAPAPWSCRWPPASPCSARPAR